MRHIGILALQGAVEPHAKVLRVMGYEPVTVRYPAQLDGLDGLVLPGGESTTQRKLVEQAGLVAPLNDFAASRRPILATCAGLILASLPPFSWLDIDVVRNGWGRQLHSFEAMDDAAQHTLIFIRAPRILSVGPRVETLASFRGEAVAVRQDHVIGATHHPEISRDGWLHQMAFEQSASR